MRRGRKETDYGGFFVFQIPVSEKQNSYWTINCQSVKKLTACRNRKIPCMSRNKWRRSFSAVTPRAMLKSEPKGSTYEDNNIFMFGSG